MKFLAREPLYLKLSYEMENPLIAPTNISLSCTLTHDLQPGDRAEPPAGDVLRHAGVVGGVALPRLDEDQVAVGGLEVVGVALGLDLNAVLEPVDLKRKIVQCSELSTQLRV